MSRRDQLVFKALISTKDEDIIVKAIIDLGAIGNFILEEVV